MNRRSNAIALAMLLLALLHVGCAEKVSDTGYVGTWERVNATAPSTISIRKEGDGYVFRWSLSDGERRVECDREGRCDEYFQKSKIYRYEFKVLPGDRPDEILVERVGTPIQPGLTALTLLDRCELKPGGLELWTRTIALNGEVAQEQSQPYKFRKISNRPF